MTPFDLRRPRTFGLAVCTSLVVALLGSGCREEQFNSERTLDAIKSGDRLRATWWTGDGGVRAFVYWTDLELATSCTFTPYADGKYRCVPNGANVMYRDAGCTQLVAAKTNCTTENYAIEYGEPPQFGCEPTAAIEPTVRPIGALVEADASVAYYKDENGACVESVFFDGTRDLYAVGDPVDKDAFVSADVELEFPGGRLGMDILRAADGSQELRGLRDLERDQVCQWLGGILANVCAPAAGAYLIPEKVDSKSPDCSGERLAYATGECGVPGAVEEFVPSACGYSTRYREVGPEYTSTVYEQEAGGMCAEVVESAFPYRFFEVGEEIPLTSLIQIVTQESGSGRIRAKLPHSEDGLLVAVPSQNNTRWRDTTLMSDCTLQRLSDGSTRCVPEGPGQGVTINGPFADPACTQRLYLHNVFGDSSCSPAPDIFHEVSNESPACGASQILSTYRRGSELQGPIYASDGTTCSEGIASPDTQYYLYGNEIEWTSLPTFQLETD